MVYIVVIGILILTVGIVMVRVNRSRSRVKIVPEPKKEPADITIEEVVHLLNASNFIDTTTLMSDFQVEKVMPDFYAKYQNQNKAGREAYYKKLIALLGRDKQEQIEMLQSAQPGFSVTEILLLLLCEMNLDNKTIARVMHSGLETLKKRKTRLKIKIREKFPEMDTALNED